MLPLDSGGVVAVLGGVDGTSGGVDVTLERGGVAGGVCLGAAAGDDAFTLDSGAFDGGALESGALESSPLETLETGALERGGVGAGDCSTVMSLKRSSTAMREKLALPGKDTWFWS
mmetsp:Transcript_27095/g.55174  ORF Transcript_27095/g.55174 Transcript_27095/m.55174 type:complete len:116 (+) Transcript_27095:1169-1516(+)